MGNWKSTLHACGWCPWHDMLDNFGISVYPPEAKFLGIFFNILKIFMISVYLLRFRNPQYSMNVYFSIPSRIHISVYPRSDFSIPWIHISVYPPRESDFNVPSTWIRFQYRWIQVSVYPRCELDYSTSMNQYFSASDTFRTSWIWMINDESSQ